MRIEDEIKDLDKLFILLCKKVEDNLLKATDSVRFNAEKHQYIKQADHFINTLEIDIEEMCLSILAKHQPLASDLRHIIAILKMNNSLERIGDLSVKFSKRHKYIKKYPAESFIIPEMIEKVREIYKLSIKSFQTKDKNLALKVCEMDDDIDNLKRKMKKKVIEESKKPESDTESLINILINSRNLERIADLATNIAEDVVFYCEGIIIRHAQV